MLRLRYVASATYERLICLDSALANLFLLNWWANQFSQIFELLDKWWS
jgi:hypothetical protein